MDNRELVINVDPTTTDKIESIDGLKVGLYPHQQVLIKQIINTMKKGYNKIAARLIIKDVDKYI
jgi:hypothetical protein